jgi:hypothetical protein
MMARRKLALRAALRDLRSRRWRRDALCGVVFWVTAGVKRTAGDGSRGGFYNVDAT